MFEQEIIDKLYSKVDTSNSNKCWLLKEKTISYEGKRYSINKIAYFDKYGKMPQQILHHKVCKNPKCCNPNHFFKDKEEYFKFLLNDPNNYKLVWNDYTNDYCHIWTKHKTDNYPLATFQNKKEKLHRWVLILQGINMEGLFARHKCHNPSCINPEHLEPGTASDNSQDMVDANRQAKGENHANCKTTEVQVLEVIKLLRTTKLSGKDISKQLNISYKAVVSIIIGKNWTDLSNMPYGSKRIDWNDDLAYERQEFALKIINLLETTELSCSKIAEKLNTTLGIVQNISYGKTWSHLSGMPLGSKRTDWNSKKDNQLELFDISNFSNALNNK